MLAIVEQNQLREYRIVGESTVAVPRRSAIPAPRGLQIGEGHISFASLYFTSTVHCRIFVSSPFSLYFSYFPCLTTGKHFRRGYRS